MTITLVKQKTLTQTHGCRPCYDGDGVTMEVYRTLGYIKRRNSWHDGNVIFRIEYITIKDWFRVANMLRIFNA